MNFINKTSRLVGLFLVGAFLLLMTAGCGKSQQQPQHQQIIVKGFYIGMPQEELSAKLKVMPGIYHDELDVVKHYGVGHQLVVEGASDYIYTAVLITGATIESLAKTYMQFDLDSNKKTVVCIAWGSDAVDVLFNSEKLNDKEFVQEFATAYNIEEFKHRQTPSGSWQWVYTSPDNIVITIWENKALSIKKGGDPTAIRKSFD